MITNFYNHYFDEQKACTFTNLNKSYLGTLYRYSHKYMRRGYMRFIKEIPIRATFLIYMNST